MTKLVFMLTQSIIDRSEPRIDSSTGTRYVDVNITLADVSMAQMTGAVVEDLDKIKTVPYPLRVQRLLLDDIVVGEPDLQQLIDWCQPRLLSIQNCPGLTFQRVPASTQYLDLSGSYKLFSGASISTILTCLPQLCHLCLEHCDLSKDHCVALANAVSRASHLTYLNLAGNDIGNVGVEIISAGLVQSKSIEELVLAECNISESGAASLASQLPRMDNLCVLDLELNPLKLDGVRDIVQSLVRCCLQRINLAQCGCDRIRHLFESSANRTLLEVNTDSNPDAQEVIQAMTSRNAASTVSLKRCLFLGSDIVRQFTSNSTFDRSLLHEIFSMSPSVQSLPQRRRFA